MYINMGGGGKSAVYSVPLVTVYRLEVELTRMEAGLMTCMALAKDADMAVSWFLICSDGMFCRKGPTGASSLVE